MESKKYVEELKFCINLWETEGGCTFGGGTKCESCAVPYLLLKFISGEVIHGDVSRLSLNDWNAKLNSLN